MDIAEMKRFALERVDALFNRKEVERVPEFVTDDYVNHEAWTGEDPGHEGFMMRMRRLHAAFPDMRMQVEDVIAEGDLVAYRATFTGTHLGELLGMAPTGRSFRVQHMHFLRMRDGRACEHWAVRDDLGMLQQLGVVPVPGGADPPRPSGGTAPPTT